MLGVQQSDHEINNEVENGKKSNFLPSQDESEPEQQGQRYEHYWNLVTTQITSGSEWTTAITNECIR
jgi:parvulin-like peptidyl-prolyl isomerase